MLYNRKIYTPSKNDWFTVIELICRHFDYKKGRFSMSKFMTNDSQNEKDHATRLYNFAQQIQDWADKHDWKGESEYLVVRYLKEEYLKEG